MRNRTITKKAEEARLRYLYRDLVLQKKIKLPYEAAVKLVGPDCAYHLYSVVDMDDIQPARAGIKPKKEERCSPGR
ncbi:MAG: hypothetical protein R3231_09015 [bacterium]|nr:hypothetical protein [bacterium]